MDLHDLPNINKIRCVYDKKGHGEGGDYFATEQCYLCHKPLCKMCGHKSGVFRYCNECWKNPVSPDGRGLCINKDGNCDPEERCYCREINE